MHEDEQHPNGAGRARGRVVAMEPEEVLTLLRAARQHSRRAHAMILLAIRHGMRCSEVTGLRLPDLDVREGWVRVQRLKGSMTTVQPLERHPGQLLDEIKVLRAWLRERPDDGTDIVFNSTHGGRMNRSTFFRLWRLLAIRAGLPREKQHVHCGKHTCGSLLAAGNVNVHLIRQRLGHRSLASAAVYCRGVTDQQAAQAARAVFAEAF